MSAKKEKDRFLYGDQTDALANNRSQFVEIYHIPSGRAVAFKAALTNFQDTFTSQWNPTEVFGRMDPIATFKRTTRTVSIGIQVMAASFKEAEVNLEKISLLEQMLYPVMDGVSTDSSVDPSVVMRGGPLVKVKMLNWIGKGLGSAGEAKDSGLLGWIDGIQFSPKIDMGVFEDSKSATLYPKGFDISFNLNVIHEETIGWKKTKKGKATFLNNTFPYGAEAVSDPQDPKTVNPTGETAPTSDNNARIKEAQASKLTGGSS